MHRTIIVLMCAAVLAVVILVLPWDSRVPSLPGGMPVCGAHQRAVHQRLGEPCGSAVLKAPDTAGTSHYDQWQYPALFGMHVLQVRYSSDSLVMRSRWSYEWLLEERYSRYKRRPGSCLRLL